MIVVVAVEGDELDDLIARHYGAAAVAAGLAAVLGANVGLAAIANDPLPPGTRLALPDLDAPAPRTELWG